MAAKPKSGPMCVVTIGFQKLLMPAEKGMKVVALLADAIEVDHDDTDYNRFVVDEAARVRFETVSADRVRLRPKPTSAARQPLLLEGRR